MRVPAAETVVEIAAPDGPSAELHVVDPARVTEVELFTTLVGSFAGPQPIDDGATIDGAELGGRYEGGVVALLDPQSVDGERVCSALPPSLVALSSATPSVCRLGELPTTGWYTPGQVVGWVELVADGECRLRWSAPTLDGGRGLSGELSATYRNVDALTATE